MKKKEETISYELIMLILFLFHLLHNYTPSQEWRDYLGMAQYFRLGSESIFIGLV